MTLDSKALLDGTPAVSDEGLLPCPFCGKPPSLDRPGGSFAASVRCREKSCGVNPESFSKDVAYAKARWNTRPPVKGDSVELVERVASLARAATALSERVVVLEGALEPLANLAGGDVNMNDPLRKWFTVGQLWDARAALKGCDALGGDK